jgi:hypothetical protein
LALSIIGFYIADIYTEVKQRPPFVVDTVLNRPQPRSVAREEKAKEGSDV